MNWRLKLTFVLVFGLLPLNGLSFANGGQLNVVATHGILADVARNVAGDHAEVNSLIPVAADQHNFIPTPSDLTTVAEADLVLINGGGWEESLLDAVESAGEGGNIVNSSACALIRPVGAAMHDDEHDDDHADDEDDHADEHDDEHADEHDDDHADPHDDDHADEHDGDHADEHDDDHADEHDDDHADEDDDEHDDDHADEHADDHADEHDDDHADEHDDEHGHDDDEMTGDIDCDAHDAELAAIVGDEAVRYQEFETLGRGKDVDCGGGHDHQDEHGHAHAEGGCDPHLWLDPHNVIYWALMIRDSLSALDHENEEAYAANAAAYAGEMVALEAEFITPALDELPDEKRVLVTGHDAFGYFASTFGFEVISTVLPGASTAVEPSARDVAAVVDVVRDEGVPAIFSDIHLSDALVNAIASETGVQVVGLHSDTLSDSDGSAATLIDYMRYNVSAIVEALKGEWR